MQKCPPPPQKVHQPRLSREWNLRPDRKTPREGDGTKRFGGRRAVTQNPNDRH